MSRLKNAWSALRGSPPAAPPAPAVAPQALSRPSETFLQADIGRAADYRKEYYKYALTIATALLAFTLSFQPTLRVEPEAKYMEFIGWAGLGASIAAGVRVHMVWSKFFISFRNFDNRGNKAGGEKHRHWLTLERRTLDIIQMIGLAIGVAGVVIFTSVNLKNVAIKTDDAGKPAVPAPCPPQPALTGSPSSQQLPSTQLPKLGATAASAGNSHCPNPKRVNDHIVC